MVSPEAVRKLVIVGAGGHGRETLDVVEACNGVEPTFEFVGFIADEADDALLEKRGALLLGPTEQLIERLAGTQITCHLAIGSGAVRSRVDGELRAIGLADRVVTLVHPLASVGTEVHLRSGAYLAPGARITTNVTFGRCVQLNVNAVVSHDCEIGDYVTISPGALVNGGVHIGARAFLGTGAIVLPERTIGQEAVIAAGAVVTKDVPAGVTARGMPARW